MSALFLQSTRSLSLSLSLSLFSLSLSLSLALFLCRLSRHQCDTTAMVRCGMLSLQLFWSPCMSPLFLQSTRALLSFSLTFSLTFSLSSLSLVAASLGHYCDGTLAFLTSLLVVMYVSPLSAVDALSHSFSVSWRRRGHGTGQHRPSPASPLPPSYSLCFGGTLVHTPYCRELSKPHQN